jgi:hypothetical protein
MVVGLALIWKLLRCSHLQRDNIFSDFLSG